MLGYKPFFCMLD